MNQKKLAYVLPQPKQWPLLIVLLSVLISLCGFLASPSSALASAVPGGNIADPVVRAVDLAKPAVVRIITTLGGRLTVHFPTATNTTETFPRGGGSYKLELSGSGAFISAHGDLLTADHVIKPPHDQSMNQYLQMKAAQDVADYINQNLNPAAPWTKEDAAGAMASGYLITESQYDQPGSKVYLSTDYTGPLSITKVENMPVNMYAEVNKVEKESAFDQKDVAIIHVNMDNTPFIQLGDSSNVAQQDELTIIGFPGNGDVSDKGNPSSVFTSSVNKIYVSALKQTDAGAPVIQVGGNIEHGDSGGPALDEHGAIVGVVSFGVDQSTPEGTSFLQSSNSAKDLLQTTTLDTTPGTFQKEWRQAFNDYAATTPGHWHKAQQDFQKLTNDFPQFHAVTPFLNYTTQQAQHEPTQQQTQGPSSNILPIIIGAAVVLLLLLLAFLLLRRRGRRPAAGTPAPGTVAVPVSPWRNEQSAPAMTPTDGTPSPATPWQQNAAAQSAQTVPGVLPPHTPPVQVAPWSQGESSGPMRPGVGQPTPVPAHPSQSPWQPVPPPPPQQGSPWQNASNGGQAQSSPQWQQGQGNPPPAAPWQREPVSNGGQAQSSPQWQQGNPPPAAPWQREPVQQGPAMRPYESYGQNGPPSQQPGGVPPYGAQTPLPATPWGGQGQANGTPYPPSPRQEGRAQPVQNEELTLPSERNAFPGAPDTR